MAGVAAFGTTLARSDGATPTAAFVDIANITSLAGPGMTRDTIDTTAHDSPSGYMEFVGSLIDPGEVTADINYDPSLDHDGEEITDVLMTDLETSTAIAYEITFPDGSVFDADLLITGFEITSNYDDKLEASLTWKVSGLPTFTPAA